MQEGVGGGEKGRSSHRKAWRRRSTKKGTVQESSLWDNRSETLRRAGITRTRGEFFAPAPINADQMCEALQLQKPTDGKLIVVQDLVLGRCSSLIDDFSKPV